MTLTMKYKRKCGVSFNTTNILTLLSCATVGQSVSRPDGKLVDGRDNGVNAAIFSSLRNGRLYLRHFLAFFGMDLAKLKTLLKPLVIIVS